jgi:hypothetical protein
MNDSIELNGLLLAVVLVREDNDEKVLLIGTVERKEDAYALVEDSLAVPLPLPKSLPQIIRPVENPSAQMFDGASHFLVLPVKTLPEKPDLTNAIKLGMRWPETGAS